MGCDILDIRARRRLTGLCRLCWRLPFGSSLAWYCAAVARGVLIELMTSRVGSGKLLQLRGHRYWSQQALWGHSIFLSNWYFCLWREAYSARSIIHCKWFDIPVIYIGSAAHLEHCGRYRPELRGGADGALLYCVPMVGEVKVADSAP